MHLSLLTVVSLQLYVRNLLDSVRVSKDCCCIPWVTIPYLPLQWITTPLCLGCSETLARNEIDFSTHVVYTLFSIAVHAEGYLYHVKQQLCCVFDFIQWLGHLYCPFLCANL